MGRKSSGSGRASTGAPGGAGKLQTMAVDAIRWRRQRTNPQAPVFTRADAAAWVANRLSRYLDQPVSYLHSLTIAQELAEAMGERPSPLTPEQLARLVVRQSALHNKGVPVEHEP